MKKLSILYALLLLIPWISLATPVPDTGQTTSYTTTFGEDSDYDINTQSYTKLDEHDNDLPDSATNWVMVRDNVTGLIWEAKTDDNKDDTYNWNDAVSYCNSLSLGGHDDWRLPTIKELSFIVNRDRNYPSINTSCFPKTNHTYYYWSSTPTYDNDFAWGVIFTYGHVFDIGKLESCFVRAVRGTQFSNDFVDNGDGTVSDLSTGLMWQQDAPTGNMFWEAALSYCENLILNNDGEWTSNTPNA